MHQISACSEEDLVERVDGGGLHDPRVVDGRPGVGVWNWSHIGVMLEPILRHLNNYNAGVVVG
jgi:hypothetical protein